MALSLLAPLPAQAATATSGTGVMITLKSPSGAVLPNIFVGVQWQQPDGTWTGPQYGPLTTDDAGQFFWATDVGKTYRFCFEDGWYQRDNNPTYRYQTRCWQDAMTLETATLVPVTTTGVKNFTQVLPVDGLAMTATEPFVTGKPAVGSTLTVADDGVAAPSDATLSYQWKYWDSATLTEVPIAGATGPTYVPTAAVDGKYLNVEVSASKTGYATTHLVAGAGRIGGTTPTTSAALTITGSAVAGQTLTAVHGTFTPAGDPPMYTWFVDGQQVTDTTDGNTFTLSSAHIGKRISVRESFYNWDLADNELHEFAQTAVVQGTFTTAPVPTISGTKAVGYTLTATPGTWGPAPVTLSYQWLRAGAAISGATASTYKLTSYDQGKGISVRVTGTKTNYVTTAKTSSTTSAILGAYSTAPTPTISGTKKVGYTLTANAGTWSPTPSSFKYQWYRGSTAISGATYRTYKLTSYDKGKVVKVKVTPVRTGYYSPGKYSAGYTIA